MAIGTYEQYKERLLSMKPNVYLNGKKIDRSNGKTGAERDLADWIVGGTYVMKQCYDTANDPDYRDVCVVEEPDAISTVISCPWRTVPLWSAPPPTRYQPAAAAAMTMTTSTTTITGVFLDFLRLERLASDGM